MNDHEEDPPLPKATPRNNNNSQALDNIVVNLQKVNVNIEREKQDVNVSREQIDVMNDQKLEKEKVHKQQAKIKNVENEQCIQNHQNKVNKENTAQISQKNIASLPDQQGQCEVQSNMIERSHRLEPQIQQAQDSTSNQVALQISNSYKQSNKLFFKHESKNEDEQLQIEHSNEKKRQEGPQFSTKSITNEQKKSTKILPKKDTPSQKMEINSKSISNQESNLATISQPEPQFPHDATSSSNLDQGNMHLREIQGDEISHLIEQQVGHQHSMNERMKQMKPLKDQQVQMFLSFDLESYKRVEPLLEELLALLKHSLKMAKLQHTKPKLYNNNNTNSTPKNLNHPPIQPSNNSNSRFFKQSRSQSRSKGSNSMHGGSNVLIDILERRKERKVDDEKGSHHIKNQESSRFIGNKNIQQKVNLIGGRPKRIPYGLGNFGGGIVTQYAFKSTHQQQQNTQINPLEANRYQHSNEQLQQQKIIQNRNKINEILASSTSNFKSFNNEQQYLQQQKQKIASFFTQEEKLPQGITNHQSDQRKYVIDSSFYNESETSKSTNAFHSRKIIKSMNFSKVIPNKKIISTTTQLSLQKGATEGKQQRASSFFNQPITEKPSLLTLTPILKVIKRYLQIVAEGRIDDIESIVGCESNLQMTTSLNDMIGRKKIFKMAMYFERAAVVAGVCYGYLMTTQEKGILRFQVQQLSPHFSNNNLQSQQNHNTLKQQTKLVLKYMINLVSFCLNNSKLIIKTLQTYYLKQQQILQNTQENSQYLKKKQSPQQQLIDKQIYKRNIETIKLNVQYVQQTLQKMFAETYHLAKNYDIDEDFGQSFKNVTKIVNKSSIQESFYTLLEYFSFYLSLAKRQRSIPFLAVAPNPYLDPTERYTLVIDFVSVFCHGTKRSKTFIFRPYSQHFLYEMSQYFDIVTICDALPQQIDKIIDILDPKSIIQHRLYKYHMVEQRLTGKFVKNLQRIGRDLSKTLLLDIQQNKVSEDAKNTIFINQWRGSKHDSTLAELCSVLISIVMQNLECDKAAKVVNRQMKINRQKGIKFINFGLNLKQQIENQSQNDENQGDLLRQSESQFE